MPVLSEPLKGVRGGITLHILCNQTSVKHQNTKILDWLSKFGDNKYVALGTKT